MNLTDLFKTTIHREPYTPIGEGPLQPDSHLARYLRADDCDVVRDFPAKPIFVPGYLGEAGERRQLGCLQLGDSERVVGPFYIPSVKEASLVDGKFRILKALCIRAESVW